ncbi:MAG: hypothetical protein GX595_10145 [Lentisphaerae bacterium]|nr:hypothetical protein [Lentisphaerota bacterium]
MSTMTMGLRRNMAMTARERLRRCYFHEELDRPAVYSRTGFPKDDPSYDRLKAYLAAHSEQKFGWHGWRVGAAPSALRVEPHSADFERHVTVVETPRGTLTSSHLVSLRGQPGLHETFLVTCREEAEAYLSLPLPEVSFSTETFEETVRQVGDRGIVDVGLGMNPAGSVAALCGSEAFALMSITDRDILHELCRRQAGILLTVTRGLLARGVGPYFSMLGEEYLVPPLHGARDFDDFNVRYDRPITDAIHDAGGRIHIHSHGRIAAVVQGFVDLGADVLHPFEAPPLGDLPAKAAKDAVRGRICLEGNLQIGDMYDRDAEAIREQTTALIRDTFDDGRGLIVCPTASPFIRGRGDDCFPQYKAMIDTVLAWRG